MFFNGRIIDITWLGQSIIIPLIVNILRVLLLKKVMELLLQDNTDERKRKVGFFLYYCLTTVCYGIFQFSIVYELCNGLGIVGLTVFYRQTWEKRIWVFFVLFSMDLACSLAVFFTFGPNNANPQLLSIQVLLLFICVTVINHINFTGKKDWSSNRDEIDFGLRQMLVLTGIPVISIFILCMLLYEGFEGTPALLLCIFTLFVNLGVFYLYHIMLENYINLRENDRYRQQIYAYQNQLKVIQESQNRIRALRHDMKNHILALQVLLKKKDKEEADKYLKSMMDFMANPSEYVITGDDSVDSMLNFKLQKANDILNAVETKITIPDKLILHSFDLNVVLGNLLDNAIEAAAQTEEKKLKIVMKLEKGILFLSIKNSCQGMVEGKKKSLETTKADRNNHGIGLKNVQRIIEKYHGDMELLCDQGNMEVNIMIYIKGL